MKARLLLVVAVVMGVALLPSSAAAGGPGVIATVPVGARPQGVDVNPNTNLIYVGNRDEGTVTVIQGATNTEIDTDDDPGNGITPITGAGSNSGVAVNTSNNYIFVADQGGDRVAVIDGNPGSANFNTVLATPGVVDLPQGVAVNPNTDRVYVANLGYPTPSNKVSVINAAPPFNVVDTVTVGTGPEGVGVNPDTNFIYVSNYGQAGAFPTGNTVSVIDGSSNDVIHTITVGGGPVSGPYGVAVNPTTNRIYVANYALDNVSVIDGVTNAELFTIPVGDGPHGVALNPTTKRIYVANWLSDNVSVIDVDPLSPNYEQVLPPPIAVGDLAHDVAANPVTNRIYVTNHYGDTVSVILWCVFEDDADCDACYDIREPGLPTAADDTDPWDFYDVPVQPLYIGGHISGDPSLLDSRDHAISIINDVLAVLEYSGTSDEGPPNGLGIDYDDDVNGDGIDDGIPYDRSVGATRSAIPNRAVSIIVDVLLVLEQSGQSCPPP